jgi:hypothetical protein
MGAWEPWVYRRSVSAACTGICVDAKNYFFGGIPMDYAGMREEDLKVLADIINDPEARPTDKIQAVKLREAIVEANTPKQSTDQKITEKDIMNAIRANKNH